MPTRNPWNRQQLLVALELYMRTPFNKIQSNNPEIRRVASAIDRTPSAVKLKLGNFASLDPKVLASGRKGLQHASSKDREIWEEMQGNVESFAVDSYRARVELGVEEESAEYSLEGKSVDDRIGEDRPVQTTARTHQAFFRSLLLGAYEGRCCITGLSVPQLLVASHIVPWHDDRCNRLNPCNGLLLSSLHDKAFDIGLITIDDDMTVRVSRKEADEDDRFYVAAIQKYNGMQIRLPLMYEPGREFLAYHREHIFQG